MLLEFFAAVMVTQEAVDPAVVGDAIQIVATNAGLYGWLGAIAGGLTVIVMVFKAVFPALWAKLPKWGRLLIVFALSGVGAGLLASFGGVGIASAIGVGIMAGLSAIGTNQVGKAGKEILKPKEPIVTDPTPG